MKIDLNLATRPFVNRAPHFVLLGIRGTLPHLRSSHP